MATVSRRILMIEIEVPEDETGESRILAALPDAVVWGEVDPVQAALLVMDHELMAA